jgi:hypothetical protein
MAHTHAHTHTHTQTHTHTHHADKYRNNRGVHDPAMVKLVDAAFGAWRSGEPVERVWHEQEERQVHEGSHELAKWHPLVHLPS